MKEFQGVDFKADSFERHVLDNAFQKPRILDAAPTTAGNELPFHGDSGRFGASLYVNLGGTVYEIALVAT